MMWEICVCLRPSECERVVVCLNYVLSKKSIYDSSMFGLFPEDENSTRQIGRVTFHFHSPAVLPLALENPDVVFISSDGKLTLVILHALGKK